jgi:hypothetical protein
MHQLALLGQPSESQVAAPKEARGGIVYVSSMAQVQLGVQRMSQVKLHNNLLSLNLRTQPTEPKLIGITRNAKGQLLPEVLSHAALEAICGLKIKVART